MNHHSPAAEAIQDAATAVREGELWRVGTLAEKSGKTVRALHLYEEMGLLQPASRTKGGFRLYDERSLLRVQWIDRLQELGFSLKEAADFLGDLRDEDSAPGAMQSLRAFYQGKLDETRAAIERLERLRAELQESLDYLAGCMSCSDHTPKQACPACSCGPHEGETPPALVAAVHDPS